MNKDDLIRCARDSGMELYGLGKNRERFIYHLGEFATAAFDAGVASGRKASVDALKALNEKYELELRKAVAAERQAMLETIDALYNSQDPNPMYQEGYNHALDNMEDFVKARSKS